MSRSIQRVFLLLNGARASAQLTAEVRQFFADRQTVIVEAQYPGESDSPSPAELLGIDLAVSMGGDGTLLHCAHLVAESGAPILPVNLGTVGFITEVPAEEWQTALEDYLNGALGISTRIMLQISVRRGDQEMATLRGLNDAVLAGSGSKLVHLSMHLAGTATANYHADGLIFATPTGSTAYSMAAGGPIVHPEMEAFVITPICPFTLSNRPVVVPAHEVVEVRIQEQQRTEVTLTVDGGAPLALQAGDRVALSRASVATRIIRSGRRTFYQVLRAKLNWADGPHA
jgi:NAD+ kinase